MACPAAEHAPCGRAGTASRRNACRVDRCGAFSLDPSTLQVTLEQPERRPRPRRNPGSAQRKKKLAGSWADTPAVPAGFDVLTMRWRCDGVELVPFTAPAALGCRRRRHCRPAGLCRAAGGQPRGRGGRAVEPRRTARPGAAGLAVDQRAAARTERRPRRRHKRLQPLHRKLQAQRHGAAPRADGRHADDLPQRNGSRTRRAGDDRTGGPMACARWAARAARRQWHAARTPGLEPAQLHLWRAGRRARALMGRAWWTGPQRSRAATKDAARSKAARPSGRSRSNWYSWPSGGARSAG